MIDPKDILYLVKQGGELRIQIDDGELVMLVNNWGFCVPIDEDGVKRGFDQLMKRYNGYEKVKKKTKTKSTKNSVSN